ncbi:autotransporter outer membrane beta-barrel domain-containing protein [Stenotrophomonas lactitubi]|uniref:autotransporter family protein n=1 Tax=Stenotrophomonas lactitubi TaxID=2045214 RepID=UPI001DAF48E6|nr:autotransporter outer membrane beta-barrel domain-containing protein [Stenotrophomonas lactitubi]CAH0142439.1 Outer membrane protein IcsA autotransporter [Stenotrophomonas lactitubi]CAH0164525.1 Outer membrane protein IcsA autotransporter [Stenotrophomonas lactitubi]CAH0164838.1 Outer membrane protein IcsA autotransporter [Stenotrophomonas lactitubi]CAH0185344.1 Outer membrane protein IcsA autotransporter [Stenotrophomonas lactitubi]
MSALSSPASLPLPRPLAVGVLLALAIAPAGMAHAGDLDNQTAEVVAGDPVEAWTLINGSRLTVMGGQSNEIGAADSSTIVLDGAQVTRVGSTTQSAITLYGNASLEATNSRFSGGGVTLWSNGASAHLVGSTITVHTADLRPTQRKAIGVDLIDLSASTGATSYARIDGTRIDVQDAPALPSLFGSGLGVRLQVGAVDIVNNSIITAARVGAMLWGEDSPPGVIRLNIDDSILQSGSGAAIQVMPLFENTYEITVANGAQLLGGDGNLLLVGVDFTTDERTDVDFTVDNARLRGNVTFDPATVTNGTLDVILRNKAQIDGRFLNVTSASIDDDSTWLLTGDSNVGRLALGNTGTIGLGDGTAFNTLTVDTFTGNGGTLAFNTHLGDDASATDKLVITGDANGQANVRVLNAGGTGAKTDRGIELIDIGGASNAQFDLIGRAVGGQYEYFLVKDTNGNWYLRSALATVPDPCVVDPSLPECKPIDPVDPVDPVDPPPPVLRPEAGAYLANQFAMDQLLRHGWRDRQGGDATAEGVRGWARVDGTQSKLSAVEDQLDLRVQRSRLQLGADVGVFDNGRGRVGAMLTAGQADAQSRSQLTGYSARGKVEGGALGVYGNWNTDALYVDASVQRGQFRNRVQGEGLAAERYNSDIWQSSLEAGYRFNIGQIGNTALRLQPELQLVYTDATTDRHEESNGTIVRSVGDDGLSGRLGLRLQGESRATVGAAVSPYLAVNWYRDGSSNGMAFDEDVLQASVPRNRYEVSAGGRVDFRSGLSGWGGLGVMRGDHGYREATANLSVAYKW